MSNPKRLKQFVGSTSITNWKGISRFGKIKIYMVCSNCHAERFEKIDWPKESKKRGEQLN